MSTPVGEAGCDIAAERTWARRYSMLSMLVLAGGAALAAVIPFFFLGNASGHDFEFHLASWMEVARQWREGVIYPRWAALANWGFGEPRFIFYPPASWMLGAALSFILPWSMVPGAFIWVALTISGVSMFTLAKEWLPTQDAMGAGVLFALNPYHLVIVYWRSDFAELLASAFIPLAVLFATRAAIRPWQALVPLALVTAAVWLSNAPAAVVVTYSIVLMLVTIAVHERRLQPLLVGGGAMALGLALAAFYIVPAAFEQSWVNISEALASGLRFQESFLFTRIADVEHTRFNSVVSWVATGMLATTICSCFAVRQRLQRQYPRLWWVLLTLIGISTVLMLPLTSPLWEHVPKLRYVQFPWRWLLALDVPFALCLVAAISGLRRLTKCAVSAVVLAGLAGTGLLLTRNHWWDPGGVAEFYRQHFSGGTGYFGTDEYEPRDTDHYDLDQGAPRVYLRRPKRAAPAPTAKIKIESWRATQKEFLVHAPEPVSAALRLLDYPAWRVEVNGRPVSAVAKQNTGEMLISLPAGTSRVRIVFATTRDRVLGNIISLLAAATILVIVVSTAHRSASTYSYGRSSFVLL